MFLKEVDRSVATPVLPPPIPATTSITSGFTNVEIGGATPSTGGASYSGGTWKVQGGLGHMEDERQLPLHLQSHHRRLRHHRESRVGPEHQPIRPGRA